MGIMTEDSYRKYWERKFRGLLIFLLDQSGSMMQEVEVGGQLYTNGVMATATLNDLIYTIINNIPTDPATGEMRDYCDILVLGYGDQVTPLLDNERAAPVSIIELATKQKGHHRVLVARKSQNGYTHVPEDHHYWIEYTASSRRTEMALALQQAYNAIYKWLEEDKKRYQSFPPIVINITDGDHNGTGNPVGEATRIRELATYDGHVLLFNCHLTSHGQQRIVFPNTEDIILTQIIDRDERAWARQLFSMSSIIPSTIIRRAKEVYKVTLVDQARGFIYNANPGDLMNFLRWGTQARTPTSGN